MGSGRNKTLNAHPRSLDHCLDTVYSSNQSTLSVLYFRPVFSKPLTITFMLTIHNQSEEDSLVYNEGNFDDQNLPKCIMDRISVDREAEQFI